MQKRRLINLLKLKSTVVILTLIMAASPLYAQFSSGDYYMLGYGFGTVSSDAAYGYKNQSTKTNNLDYYKDSFNHGSVYVKYMSVDRTGLMAMDFDLITTLGAVMGGLLGDFDITSLPGTGEWNDLDKNLGKYKSASSPKLYSTGSDFTYGNLDLLFGDREMMFGFHLGLNGTGGNDDDEFNNFEAFSGPNHNFRYLANKIYWSIGFANAYFFNENLLLLSRANVIWGWKDNGVRELDNNTWGFEIFPTVRFVWGGDIGLFVDGFVKYRNFFEVESVVDASRVKEKIKIPGFSTTHIGVTIGVYLRD